MNQLSIRLLCAVLAPLPLACVAADVPNKVEITYDVTWNGMKIGKGEDRFEHDGKQFSIFSDTKTVGLASALYNLKVRREIHGTITPAGLQPGSFVEERSKKPRKSVHFDWANKQATLDSGSGPQTVPLPEYAVFDQSSFAWSFAFDPPDGKEGKVALTDGRKLTDYRYAVVGKEKISTPLGEMETLHIKKIQEAGDKRGFEFWLATQKHFIPVRIVFTDDGSAVDSVVRSLTLPAKR